MQFVIGKECPIGGCPEGFKISSKAEWRKHCNAHHGGEHSDAAIVKPTDDDKDAIIASLTRDLASLTEWTRRKELLH